MESPSQDHDQTQETQPEVAPAERRRRPLRPNEEDADRLIFCSEFDLSEGAQPLFTSEVAHLLRQKVDQNSRQHSNQVLIKSLEHAERFSQLENTVQAIHVRDQLSAVKPELHPFEIAQLASLMPKDAEEARTIIPSLADRYDDEQLTTILKDMDVFL